MLFIPQVPLMILVLLPLVFLVLVPLMFLVLLPLNQMRIMEASRDGTCGRSGQSGCAERAERHNQRRGCGTSCGARSARLGGEKRRS